MKELKHIQISKSTWEQLRHFCSQEGYTIKGYVEKLIKNDLNEKVLEVQRNKTTN